jgi:predicted N-acetyltransferase YhbS
MTLTDQLSKHINIREATLADAAMLAHLICEAFEQYRGQLDPPSGAHNETAARVGERLATTPALLAEVDGVAVGGVFYKVEADHLYLSRLSVLPSYQRQGIGQALVAAVEARALALGRPRVRLGVRLALPALRASYERLGYRLVQYAAHPGYSQPTYIYMEKALRS